MYKIRGIGPGPHAFIEAVQPYPQRWRNDYCFAVKVLNDLWNQDKHRLVHLWGLRFHDPKISLAPGQAALDCGVYFDARVRHENAIVLKVVCTTPHPEMKMNSQVASSLVFAAGKGKRGGSYSLWDIARCNIDIINKLIGAIGHQDRPINIAIWTAGPSFPTRHGTSTP
jgi:hypothetical protein